MTTRPLQAGPRPRRLPLVVLVPSVLVAAAVAIPLVYLLVRGAEAQGIVQFMMRPRTLNVVWTSLALAFTVTTATLALALPVAWLTVRSDLPLRRFWSVVTVLPLVIPSYVGAYAFVSAFASGGLVSSLFGIATPNPYGFWGATLVLTLFNYPFMLLALRAGLRGLDPSLEEASRSLGRSPLRTFFTVTLPHLRPAIAAGALLVSLYILSDFGAVAMLRVDTFTRAIYIQYQNSFNRSGAAILALMLVALILVIFVFDAFVRGRAKLARTGSGSARLAKVARLGAWRWPATLFLVALVTLSLVAPLGVITTWFLRGIAGSQSAVFELRPIWNAVSVSLLTAFAATLAAVPVAVLAVRFPSKPAAILERLAYLGYALPGIVVALSLVFFGARYVPWLYQTTGMLVFAYGVLFLPQALGNIRAALLQVNPHLEEASRSLGRSPGRTMLEVTLPLVRPGLVTGAALVFLTTMKELPATLLLAPIGFNTLATRIWSWTAEAFFANAAPYALVLVLVSSLSVAILLAHEERTS